MIDAGFAMLRMRTLLLLLLVMAATMSAGYVKLKFKGGELSYTNGDILIVKCAKGVADALNRSESELQKLNDIVRVKVIMIEACEPPSRGYSHVLELLNVELLSQSQVILRLPPTGAPLCADHLTGNLAYLVNLTLTIPTGNVKPPPSPCVNLLSNLAGLKRLEVRNVPLPQDLLASSSLGNISSLILANVGAVRVPASVFAGLIAMSITEEVQLEGPAPAARIVALTMSKNMSLSQTRFPAATAMSLIKWNEKEGFEWTPDAWRACSALTSLQVYSANFSSLIDQWLGNCTALELLELNHATYLKTLPPNLLKGRCASNVEPSQCPSSALKSLVIKYSGLMWLPYQLFDPVPNLQHLDLSHNQLMDLPGAIFTIPTNLKILNLANNKLQNSVYGTIQTLIQLNKLDLANNYNLGNNCSGTKDIKSGFSSLMHMKKLNMLNLSSTKVSRICSDWRVLLLNLHTLILDKTSITRLSYDDLQYKRNALITKAVVYLRHVNVSVIDYSQKDEEDAMNASDAVVTIYLNKPFICDCESFRAVRAFRNKPSHVDFSGLLMCNIKSKVKPLKQVPLDDMLCTRQCADSLPAGCDCAERLDDDPSGEFVHIRATCERKGLRELPAVPSMDGGLRVKWDLRLAFNNITVLDKLSPKVRMLDLRNNSMERVSATAANALGDISQLYLDGNRLVCDCAAMPLLDAVARLQQRNNGTDASLAFCKDGRSLVAAVAARHSCFSRDKDGGSGWTGTPLLIAVGVAMAALLLGALALIAALAKPTRRARLKGVLLRWGWLPRASEPDDSRPYDVFLSFAHEDEEFAREMAARLETGPRPLRLCLHSRDWAPGEYIDAQIAASVRSARRTLCVVSRHFAASRWTRVELREALAEGTRGGTPRLVLVLLEEASALPTLDRELRRCLARCTYLQRDHPRFWERLREALPQPRSYEPAPAPAPAPESAPAAAAA